MAVRTITYRELTPAQRAKAARQARERLTGFLNNPFLSVGQRQAIFDKIAKLTPWEKLQLDDPATLRAPLPLPAPRTIAALPQRSQHHDVQVTEQIDTKEQVS
jgi:hypothetical protein